MMHLSKMPINLQFHMKTLIYNDHYTVCQSGKTDNNIREA